MSPNWAVFGFDYDIRIDVTDTVPKGRIPTAKDRVLKLFELRLRLRDRLVDARERMARYYNDNHVPK